MRKPTVITMDGFGKVAIATEGYVVKGGLNAGPPTTPRPPAPKPSPSANQSVLYVRKPSS